MIVKLYGTIDEVLEKSFVINVENVYYEIFCDKSFLSRISENEKIYVFTYYSLKENVRELYGFETKEDRDFFKFLIGIRGVAEKTVISWLSCISSDELKLILQSEDIDSLCKLPQVGRKTGEKILTEIRHNIKKNFEITGLNKKDYNKDVINNAISALSTLGLPNSIAKEKANENYKVGMNVSELTSICLQKK